MEMAQWRQACQSPQDVRTAYVIACHDTAFQGLTHAKEGMSPQETGQASNTGEGTPIEACLPGRSRRNILPRSLKRFSEIRSVT